MHAVRDLGERLRRLADPRPSDPDVYNLASGLGLHYWLAQAGDELDDVLEQIG